MSKDANSFGHDKALAWESRGFVYTKKRMHRFDTPSFRYWNIQKQCMALVFYFTQLCFLDEELGKFSSCFGIRFLNAISGCKISTPKVIG